MGVVTKSWIIDCTVLVSVAVPFLYLIRNTVAFKILAITSIGIFLFYQYKFRHWKRFNIAQVTPWFPMGNLSAIFRKCPGDVLKDLYNATEGHPFAGIWFLYHPAILIRDPELIKQILVKDFGIFHERGIYVNKNDDPLSAHLFSTSGTKWRSIRVKLTPTFTTGKMKAMLPQFAELALKLETNLESLANDKAVIDVKEWAARFSTDLTTLTAFGIRTNALDNPEEPFRQMGKKLLKPSIFTIIRSLMPLVMPDLSSLLGILQCPKDITAFLKNAIEDIVDYREKNNIEQDDYMGILLQLKNKRALNKNDGIYSFHDENNDQDHQFTVADVAAQTFVFFVAGFETAATIIAWAIFELATNPDIQERTREEIHTVLKRHNGKITYDALNEMPYLDMVVEETLRKYPPVPLILRKATKPYTIPGSDFTMPAGTQIHISIHGLQRDPKYFPNPDKFDPERFSHEEKSKRHHYSYLPFGEGPRNCFGMRYSMMQKKSGLVAMLNKYKFTFAPESPNPMKFDQDSFVFAPKGGMFLRIQKI